MLSSSVVSGSATPWYVVPKVPLFVKISRQEYWSGLPFLTPEHIPNPGIEYISLGTPALARRLFNMHRLGSIQNLLIL